MALTSVQTFYLPEDEATVVELLGKHAGRALIVAGGTFLHGLISRGLLTGIEALIDIQKLGLNTINPGSEGLEIGATTKLSQLKASGSTQQNPWLGAVQDATEYPPVQVMNSATVGGCVASSCPFFDLPVSFLALNSVVTARGPGGIRDIPLDEFFTGLFETALEPDEFVTGMRLPKADGNTVSAFMKMETNANDLAILNVAVCLTTGGDGSCRKARVFIGGGVGEAPVRSPSAERVLQGAPLSDEVFKQAGEAAQSDVDPISDHRASAAYRKAITRVLVERTLCRSRGRLKGK